MSSATTTTEAHGKRTITLLTSIELYVDTFGVRYAAAPALSGHVLTTTARSALRSPGRRQSEKSMTASKAGGRPLGEQASWMRGN